MRNESHFLGRDTGQGWGESGIRRIWGERGPGGGRGDVYGEREWDMGGVSAGVVGVLGIPEGIAPMSWGWERGSFLRCGGGGGRTRIWVRQEPKVLHVSPILPLAPSRRMFVDRLTDLMPDPTFVSLPSQSSPSSSPTTRPTCWRPSRPRRSSTPRPRCPRSSGTLSWHHKPSRLAGPPFYPGRSPRWLS